MNEMPKHLEGIEASMLKMNKVMTAFDKLNNKEKWFFMDWLEKKRPLKGDL